MYTIFSIKINFDSKQGGGAPDIATQHAQIAGQLQQKEQKKDDYQGLIANLPGGKMIESATSALDVLNKSVAPQIDSVVNLGKDANLQTGSLLASVNLGGVMGNLKILGEQINVKADAFDPSILTGQIPSIDGSGAGESSQMNQNSGGNEDFSGNQSTYNNQSNDGGYESQQSYSSQQNNLPDLSGIRQAGGGGGGDQDFLPPSDFSSKFASKGGGGNFVSKISSASQGEGGHSID